MCDKSFVHWYTICVTSTFGKKVSGFRRLPKSKFPRENEIQSNRTTPLPPPNKERFAFHASIYPRTLKSPQREKEEKRTAVFIHTVC